MLQDNLQQALSDKDKVHQAEFDACKARVAEVEQLHENSQAAISSLQNELNENENLLQDKAYQSLNDQDKLHQADIDTWRSRVTEVEEARKIDQETIASLEDMLNQKESLLQDNLQLALIEKDQLHKSDVGTWKSKLVELKESNDALHRELSEMSAQTSLPEDHIVCTQEISSLKMDLQNVLNNNEKKTIQRNLELATAKAEFHNAINSCNELQEENQRLKMDIESLNPVENRNFEKEMNSAHARFESMEKALDNRVTRLTREKDKLVADFNDEMINKEEEHTATKIELSAWKLEMQNALNDMESLKRERDELKAQIQTSNM